MQNPDIIKEIQDLTFLKWSHIRNSSGTGGTFLKSGSEIDNVKTYYKLSNFDPVKGVVGHECVNEIIADRLLTILGVEHLSYQLINARIEIEENYYNTYLCASRDFKDRGESKVALDDYYRVNALPGESHYDFCIRQGWQNLIHQMIAVDFIILNRDRHGANIEVLRNARNHTVRPAPLFDHGLSLMYSCRTDKEIRDFDIFEDKKCQNFIGSQSCLENLSLIEDKTKVFKNQLKQEDKGTILNGLEDVLSKEHLDKIWDMIFKRYERYNA
ncbi:MAG: hypothetical protein IK152_06785 [Lachnospiraceae bacterium]|nr:hypothetical protein [Lachnospiraceae bacterium]